MKRAVRALLATAALGAAFLLPRPAAAETPEMVTDRPDQTESSSIVPIDRIQIEVGWTLSHDEIGGVENEAREAPGVLVRAGFSDRMEMRLGYDGYIAEEVDDGSSSAEESGSGDGSVGLKIFLREEEGRIPETAVILSLSLPIGAEEFSSHGVDPTVLLCQSLTLGGPFSLGWNLGGTLPSREDADGDRETDSYLKYSVALGAGLGDRVGLFAEFFGEAPVDATTGALNSVDGGITFLLRHNVQIDCAGGAALSEDGADWFAGAGLSLRFPD